MKRRHKIKRYNKIYRRSKFHLSFTPVQIAFFIVILLILFSLGWVVAKTITDRINNPPTKEELLPQIDDQPTEDNNDGTISNGTNDDNVKNDNYMFLDINVAQNDTLLKSFIDEVKTKGINKVIYTAKNSNGDIFYNTSNTNAIASGAVTVSLDIGALNNKLKENGIELTVEVSAFKDHKMPLKFLGASVKYKGSQFRWLDNSVEKGGRAWLDPSNPVAQGYITSIIDEIYNFGITNIIVNDFYYPHNVIGLNLATFNSGNDPNSKINALKTYMTQLQDNAKSKNKNISFNVLLSELMTPTGIPYGTGVITPSEAVVNLSEGLGNYNILVNNAPFSLDAGTLSTEEGKINYFTTLINDIKLKLPKETKLTLVMTNTDVDLIKDRVENVNFIRK